MKKFIAIIGRRNAGKSTVIVSLTGCLNRGFQGTVTDQSNNENIYVIASSPQEKNLSPGAFQSILTQVGQDKRCRGLVMAIQASHPRKRLSLEDIIREVQDTNSFEPYLFILEPIYSQPPEAQPISTDVNRRLRNTGLIPQVLDGRRFAFLNARNINQTSQMF
ncbi:MAG: hypothetical protein H8D56_22310 [Planctomycetes bacterium]|nr:hypothetical protein [Planctomycetota bacterium]MBL7145845.1 hypothetical protein [Phycisphaerae bacterium]